MARHLSCLIFVLSAFVASGLAIHAVPTSNTSYVVVTSDVLVPGSELLIDLHLLDLVRSDPKEEEDGKEPSAECVLDLSVSADDHLWHRSLWKIEVEKTPKSFAKTLRILVQSDERSLGDKSNLKVESSSCFKFSRSFEVPTGRRELLVSILTDKLKYRPGETVMINPLVLTQELKPHLKPFNLSLHDSEDDLRFQWLDVVSEDGLPRKEYFTPVFARSNGMVLAFESHEQVVNHTFEIEVPGGPYKKEFFLVEVRCPRYHTLLSDDESKSPSLDFSVVASLPSGVPLKGMVELQLQLSIGNNTRHGSLPPVELVAGHKEFSLKAEEVKRILGMKTEEPLTGHEVNVSVQVQELRPLRGERSGDEERKNKEESKKDEGELDVVVPVTRNVLVTFVDRSQVLFFSEFTPVFFRPGLSYVGHVLLKPVEDEVPVSSEEKEVTVKVKHFASSSEGPREEKLTLKVKPNSLGEFSLKVPKEDIKLELEAQFVDKESGKAVEAHLAGLLPFATKHGHFVQVLMDQKPPKVVVGETLKFKVESSFPTSEVLYQVSSQSGLVLSGRLVVPSPATEHDFSLVIPQNVSHLLLTPRLLVEVLSPSNEILSDSLRFVVEQKQESPLELLVESEVTELGEVVEVIVKAEPFTNVHLLTVSDVLAFEPKEQQLRKLIALEKMSRYVQKLNTSQFSRTIDEFAATISNIPSLAPDSQRVHNESESVLLTDGLSFIDTGKPWPIPAQKNGTLDDLEQSTLDVIEEFDSKLWRQNIDVGPSGQETLRLVLPREAALYTVAAFGVRPGKRIVVVERPIQFTSTSKVLASLRHPETLVRGEEILLEVHLFNNHEKEVKVDVTVRETGLRLKNEKGDKGEKIERQVVLKPNQLEVVTVPLKTPATRQKPLRFKVDVVSDGVHHKLGSTIRLDYQGYPVMMTESFMLDNFNGEQVLQLDVPKNITNPIENSERALVSVYGHPLGPAIEYICKELSDSRSLEGTKLWFVMAMNVVEHISNNSLFDNPEETALSNDVLERDECIESVIDSLRYQLGLKNENGSYSSLGGDVGLTSFMLDSMVLLRKVISWTQEDIVETVKWLAKQQNEDGTFVEDENEFYEEAEHVPLTSQVLASLLDASNKFDLPGEEVKLVKSVAEKSVGYLEKVTLKGDLDNDPYSLNLAAYALTLAKSDKLFEVLKRRNKLMVCEGNKIYWRVEGEDESLEGQSLNVEATSYAILTSLAMNDLDGARPYVNFVLGSIKLNGEFVATEDTHVALKALSQYFRLYDEYHGHQRINIDANITLSNERQYSLKVLSPFYAGSLYFDHSNMNLSSPLKVESSGKGIFLVQSVPVFNEATEPSRPTSFDLKVQVTKKNPAHVHLKVCALNLEKSPRGPYIGEMTLLSGFELNMEKIQGEPKPQVLQRDDKVYLIFNEVKPEEPSCVDLCLDKLYQVGSLAPRFIKLRLGSESGEYVTRPYGGNQVVNSI